MKFLFYAGGLSGAIISTLLAITTIFLPCQPILLSSLLCSDGLFMIRKSYLYLWTVRIFFASLELILFINITISSIYYLLLIFLSGVAFLWVECRTFIKEFNAGFARIVGYRKFQVFEKLLNSCIRSMIFLVTALIIPAFQILIFFAAIKLHHSGDPNSFEVFVFGWCYVVCLVFTVIVFTSTAQINNLSKTWILRCKWGNVKKLERMVYKSLKPLRLEFGNNFVEAVTPLVVQEFCMRQTVSFLILTRGMVYLNKKNSLSSIATAK